MSSEKVPKYIYAQEHKLYYYYYHFGRHWENKTENEQKQPAEYFFHQHRKKMARNTSEPSQF